MPEGRSKLMTCFTPGMSRPRAATEVATRMGALPVLKSANASSRSLCKRSLIEREEKLVYHTLGQNANIIFSQFKN